MAPLDSVDSLFGYPVEGVKEARFESLPSVNEMNFGLTSVGAFELSGNGNLTVTMGGPDTTPMELNRISVYGGVKQFARSANLENLAVKEFKLTGENNGKHLSLPFDSLHRLTVKEEHSTERLELPPAAVGWEDFTLDIESGNRLDMSSEYSIDENGESKQTW